MEINERSKCTTQYVHAYLLAGIGFLKQRDQLWREQKKPRRTCSRPNRINYPVHIIGHLYILCIYPLDRYSLTYWGRTLLHISVEWYQFLCGYFPCTYCCKRCLSGVDEDCLYCCLVSNRWMSDLTWSDQLQCALGWKADRSTPDSAFLFGALQVCIEYTVFLCMLLFRPNIEYLAHLSTCITKTDEVGLGRSYTSSIRWLEMNLAKRRHQNYLYVVFPTLWDICYVK